MALDAAINFGKCTVGQGYDDAATSIALSSGHGAKLPTPSADGEFNLVWWNSTDYPDPSDDPNVEIVRCTARSTDTLTVTRAQEGTSASAKETAGKTYKMLLVFTKKMKDDIEALIPTGTEVWGETPSGTMNGSNTDFTLANTPVEGTVRLYLNGMRLKEDSDYTISGDTISLTFAPSSGEALLADYKH